jgi:hypothetical protein
MFRRFLYISVSLLLISCTRGDYETVEIIGKDPTTSEIRIRGMGVRLSDGSILTSDHVVRGGMRYEVWGMRYDVWERDMIGDRALLIRSDIGILPLLGGARGGTGSRIPLLVSPIRGETKIQKWDPIYTEVSRSGSIVKQVGKVVDPSGSVTGYDTTWWVVTLSGIVLTDLDLLPGDSGAPIYTLDRELIDVVHVR